MELVERWDAHMREMAKVHLEESNKVAAAVVAVDAVDVDSGGD